MVRTEIASNFDIVVAGAGPVGLVSALALARTGFSVALIGPDMAGRDLRTTALMAPALDYLQTLGVDTAFGGAAEPLETMRIIDGTRRLVRAPTVTFRAPELGMDSFGRNIPNAALHETLVAALGGSLLVEVIPEGVASWSLTSDLAEAQLASGRVVSAKLAVAADGRNSPAREAAGIRTIGHPYPQTALVLSFSHARPHGNVSNEFHMETGPFTQVPLPGQRSSLVWVLGPQEADAMMLLSDADLAAQIEQRMDSILGKVEVEPGRQVYPLSASMPLSFARNRVALVGEAAHVVPPIGAQGLNLGLRDVEAIAAIAARHSQDPGSDTALAEYDRRRRPDIMARNAAVNLLNRSLLSSMLPAQLARSAGLSLLERFGPLRQFVMRESMAPGSGWSGFFSQGKRSGGSSPDVMA